MGDMNCTKRCVLETQTIPQLEKDLSDIAEIKADRHAELIKSITALNINKASKWYHSPEALSKVSNYWLTYMLKQRDDIAFTDEGFGLDEDVTTTAKGSPTLL